MMNRVRIPAAQKCWVKMEFVNIYHLKFMPLTPKSIPSCMTARVAVAAIVSGL